MSGQIIYVNCPDINEQVNPGSNIWLPNVRSILKPYCVPCSIGWEALLNIYLINKGVVMGVIVGFCPYKEIYLGQIFFLEEALKIGGGGGGGLRNKYLTYCSLIVCVTYSSHSC